MFIDGPELLSDRFQGLLVTIATEHAGCSCLRVN